MTLSEQDISISLDPLMHQKYSSISIWSIIKFGFITDEQYKEIVNSPLFHIVNKTLRNQEFYLSHVGLLYKNT